jgi:hypothetical protein
MSTKENKDLSNSTTSKEIPVRVDSKTGEIIFTVSRSDLKKAWDAAKNKGKKR